MALPKGSKKRDWLRAVAREVLQMDEEDERDEGQLSRDAKAADRWSQRRDAAANRAQGEGRLAT